MSEKGSMGWPTAVLRSLDMNKFYGKVLSVTHPTDSDPLLRVEFKINTATDLIINEPIVIEFEVNSSFPSSLPRIILRDSSVFEQMEGASCDGNQLVIRWMEKAKYPLSVWVYAIRSLFANPQHQPWDTPPALQSDFSLNNGQPTISAPALIGGTGRIRGKRLYMEDVDFCHTISPRGRSITIYGVLDGHGGQECARYASEEIPSHIVSAIGAGLSQQESLYQSFLKTDKEFIKSNTSQLKAGCTSTVMVFDHLSGLTSVANSGDTRAVMSRLRTAVDLTRDMKSSSPIEIARVLSCGGYIINGRVLGSLAVARALGDCQLKEINDRAVIADPEVTSFYFQSDDEFVVIATDGLWDVMSSQTVIDMVWTALLEQQLYPLPASRDDSATSMALGKIGESLANHASNYLNSADNITVTIILLHHSSAPFVPAPSTSSSLSRPSYRSGSSLSSEEKPFASSSSGSTSAYSSRSSPRETSNNATAAAVSVPYGSGYGAAEKRKTESAVSEDDLMRFLMDDSNF